MANETKIFNAEIHEKSVSATLLFRKKMLNKQPEVLAYLKTLSQLTSTDLESEEGQKLQSEIEIFEAGIAEGFGFELDKEIDSNKRFLEAAKLTRFKRGVEISEKVEAIKEHQKKQLEKIAKQNEKIAKQNAKKEAKATADPALTAATSPIKKMLSSKSKKTKDTTEPAAPENVTKSVTA